MREPGKPLFLERQSYRRRRMIDASRIAPLFGGFLFLIPLVWPDAGENTGPQLAQKGLFIFVVWFLLVLVSALIAARLKPGAPDGKDADSPDGQG